MTEPFPNAYTDAARAGAYADLEFAGTYWLAFRDIPDLIARHVTGTSALDFGCGAGRSTRFLQSQGFTTVGVDISSAMLAHARVRDPSGTYLQVPDGDLSSLSRRRFDLVFCAYPFDNIAGQDRRVQLFRELGELLGVEGRLINLVSSPALYHHDWLSFSAREFPENPGASDGEAVRVTIREGADQRPVDDLYWTDASYRDTYAAAGLTLVETHRPLGRGNDPHRWTTELTVSPWAIYVLRP
ncbi:MAG TPA: class I SAM-dependent methyltransferase [Gemmatimonadales bacterium]|nr:class I SAM-dependent methyltransferase [Gemmatimonadales bacterium]